jgi:hypothetical protein
MRIRVGTAIALALGVLAMLTPADASAAPCAEGRYVITGNPRATGKPTLKSGSITLRNATVALSAGCPATLVRIKQVKRAKGVMKGRTKVRAKWAQCSGVRGKVRLKASIDNTCKRMWGTISSKRGKTRFDAELSLCGNGMVDTGEQCDGAACGNGVACTDNCECDPNGIPGPGCTPGVDGCPGDGGHSTTSTTIDTGGGGGVTTTSLPNGGATTTTISGGGTTTSTTLPGNLGDHFKCYKLREGSSRFQPGPVNLVDQFGASASVAQEPERLCNPVDKEGEGISDPTAHLMCYDLQQEPNFAKRDVVVRNQFGDQILTVVRPDSLCAPAEKDGVESPLNLNHFKCYRVAQRHGKFAPRTVQLGDQFESKTAVVEKPLLMCNPVDKNGEGVVNPAAHLTCYRIVDAAGQSDFIPRDVSVQDQFTEQLVKAFRGTCRKASLLCVPSLKNPGAGTTTTTVPPPTTSTSQPTPTSTSSTSSTSTPVPTTSSTSTQTPTTSSTSTPVPTTSSTSTPVPTTSSTSTQTPTTSSTSTPVPTTSSTSTPTPTPTTSSTSTPVPTTSSTSAPIPTTSSSTTSTSSTTSSTAALCCNGETNLKFLTANAPGDCGDIIDQNGMLVTNIQCAGLYTGGGGNSVPLPFAVPDLGESITAISNCMTNVATVGPVTSAQTGSNRNCSAAGCLFGAPLAVPNPGSTPTSVCVTNALSQAPAGTVNCATGETSLSAPLSSFLYLTGDTATDPMSTISGIQPCPICSTGTCIGGPNNGMSCTNGTSATGLGAAYPTSHDCPPDPMFNIGTLPVAFSLTTGTLTWTGTPATNDTGSTVSVQNRVFSGFCRDADATGAFAGTTPANAQLCWENGMAVGAACNGTFESCEQRNNGAFGPAGGANRTIRAIGNGMSLASGTAPATLVSVFTIRPTFDPTVDSAGDLPGPGAVALPGNATLCSDPMACN